MCANLFRLESVRYRRSFSFLKLIPIVILLLYCVGLVQLFVVKGNISIADFGLLKVILYSSLADIFVKLFLQKRIVGYPSYIITLPIPKRERYLYEFEQSAISLWNYYLLLIFLPILMLIDSASVAWGAIVLILAASYTNCFALRVWEKTQSVAIRIALILLPAYYALLIWQNGFSINIWTVCGIQLLIAIAFVYISLRIKTYEEERNKKSRVIDLSWSKYSIDFLPFVRSRRLRIQLIPILYILVMLYTQRMMFDLWLFLYVLAGTALITQWHFAIEANYWNFLRTQPNGVKMIFYRKFKLIFWLQMIVMPTCIPLIFLHDDISLTSIIAINFFSATFVNMIQFMLFMIAKRFDLWGSTLFNYQGSNMTAFFVYIALIAILCFLFQFFEHSGNYTAEYIIFFGLGILCLIFKEI